MSPQHCDVVDGLGVANPAGPDGQVPLSANTGEINNREEPIQGSYIDRLLTGDTVLDYVNLNDKNWLLDVFIIIDI